MKILFIAHYFQPEPNFFFGLPFAQELSQRGHEVEVLTGFPNYPGGKLYPGYHQHWKMVEEMNGIRITRVPLYPSHDQSAIKRIISYSSLALTQALAGISYRFKADVAYVCQGPATIGLPAIVFKGLKGVPFVYQIQDLWPDSLSATGMFDSGLGMKLLHNWCKLVYRKAAHITVIAPGMKEKLLERGVPAEKVSVLFNWCDEQALLTPAHTDSDWLERLLPSDSFNILYAGNLGNAQALETVIQTAVMLQQEPGIRFVLVGNGIAKEKLQALAAQKQLRNVFFHPRVSAGEAGKLLQKSDVVLTHLRREPLFDITIPSKIQAYLAAGRPILAAAGRDAGDLVEKAGAGIKVTPENPEEMARAVLKFRRMGKEKLQEMGNRGREFYYRELSFSVGVSHFEQLFEQARRK
ncbi:glycosyltransferase family 4 protein [Victivallis vadensis]|uniref:glycosyltransferase family 4 protein n=1 Tax=Victivallis vadensis TaxID=172901 RepID=UPI0023EFAAB2|nr:glycosyltransferase family 4 protein [Victivallis vadensis]